MCSYTVIARNCGTQLPSRPNSSGHLASTILPYRVCLEVSTKYCRIHLVHPESSRVTVIGIILPYVYSHNLPRGCCNHCEAALFTIHPQETKHLPGRKCFNLHETGD